MPLHKFRIKAGPKIVDSSIEMDGKPIKGVRRASFDLRADDMTILKLEVMGEILVEGEFEESAILQVEQPAVSKG